MSTSQPVTWLESGSLDQVRWALSQVLPALAERPVVLSDRVITGDPRFFQGSAVVDNAYVVKFAWSEPAARRIVHEARILRTLGDAAEGLAAPRLVAAATAPAFLVTRLVHGEPLSWEQANQITAKRRSRLAGDIASFLAALHDPATLAAVRGAGIELEVPEPQATTDELRDRFVGYLMPSQRPKVNEWCDWADAVLEAPSRSVLLHGDLHNYNLVWDPPSGALRLVADFEQAGVGDPAFDFRYLPGAADTVELFAELAGNYEQATEDKVDLQRVLAWHMRTVLGDALWRTDAGVPLPGSGGTPISWVDELDIRMHSLLS